uniref:LIM and calponin homology domains-containing protein 1 n=1 Tax=Parascaris univalens TaxID=6257 RepID=A0A915BAF1_PARUN
VGESAATGKWETNNNAQIRRLCSTIACLADECSRVDRLIPKLDTSAVEPLLNYNDWLNNRRSTISFSSLASPLDFPPLDIVSSLSLIVEQVCSAEEQRNRSETFSASSDEGFDTMVECSYAVSKYLADASSEYSTEDLSSYSTGTKSSRSCSPYIGERCFPGVEQQIPTRPQVKLTSQVAHNPLQFVSAKTSAVALCEQAKQQIIMSEEQKRVRAEALKAMRSSSNVDEEPAWQRNLDSWLSKRKSAISKSRKVDTPKLPFKGLTRMSETKPTMRGAMEANTKNDDEYEMKEKDEVLGVRDSPFAEEYTDSGIENSKVSPYRHSPSTSSELSPQGDWIRSRDYNVDPTDISNYVVQASWQIQHSPKHSSTSSMRPFEGLQQRVARYDPQTTHVDTLLRVDDSQHQTLEKDVDKQAFIGSSERSSRGSKAEVDSSRQASRGTAVVSSRAVKGTVSELAAKFECSQSHEPKHDVEKVFPVAHKERTANHIQTVKNDSLGSNETNLETINARRDDGQNIKLGVELCREQTANVTAVKFPTRQQKCATMRSFKEFPEASRKENDDVANTYKASSSYVPYTAANLAAIKERASLGESSNTTPPATVKKEPPEPPARPHDPPSKNVEDASRRVQSVMCTVEIPFEDVPGAAYQPNNTDQHEGTLPDADGIMIVNIDLGHHTKNPRKYFGFTVAGGKDKDAALRVESVIAGTPADECGLQVGDLILSVNGETVDDRYHQSVIRMLHEAARLGEVELKIKRVSCFAETEHERQHIASSLSEVDDARPKLVRNYDITPLRSDPASPVQQKIVGFTKRAEEMTYIPLSKKPPPVPQKPSPPPPPPSSTLPPEEEEEDHDDDTQPGRSFVDSREWRQIIEQQRLPSAGDTSGKNRMDADSKFRIVHSSAGSLKESLLNSSSWSSARSLRSTGLGDVSKLNNTGMSAVESLKPKNTTSVLRTSVEVLHRFPEQTHRLSTEAERPSEVLSSDGGREQCCSNAKPSEPVVAVSGKHRCSHCQLELGRGAAMIIESLNLFYHLGCFRCYVCNRSLGNGTQGADVRVRQSKLHCQTCYSNDEAGLKFSQV